MTSRLLLTFALVLILALGPAPVRAESTPAPVTETCTLESEKHPGEQCLLCSGWEGDAAKCLKRLSSKGFHQKCRTPGTDNWNEVWCRPEQGAGK